MSDEQQDLAPTTGNPNATAATANMTTTTNKATATDGIPVINMQSETAADELLQAFSTIGFATLINHSIPSIVMDGAFAASKSFFSSSIDEKMKRKFQGHESNRGYIPVGAEAYENGPDKKETFDIGNDSDAEGYQNDWPSNHFQTTMQTYFREFDALHLRIMTHLAIAMNMDTDDYFVQRCNERHENLRLLHYPAVPKEASNNDALIQRGNIHTDFGTITLLVQDGIGGLRAQRLDGTWLSVPPIKDSIVVNIGDMFQRWSNDLLRATPHQVVESKPSKQYHGDDDTGTDTNDDAAPSQEITEMIPERYSIAFFCNANKSVLLECLEQCVSEKNPAKYPVVNAHDYLTMRLSQTISA